MRLLFYVLLPGLLLIGSMALTAECDLLYSSTGEAESDNFGKSVSGAGDVDGDGSCDVADLTSLVNYLYTGEPAPNADP